MLGRRSLEAYEAFGARIGLRQVGHLFLCRTEEEIAAVEASTRPQRELGCTSRLVPPASL